MKKIVSMMVIAIALFICTSCGSLGDTTVYMNEGTIADKCMGQVVDAINAQDTDALKTLFSKQALEENDRMYEQIQTLLYLFKTPVVSWEQDHWYASESSSAGKRTQEIRSWYVLKTETETYLFMMIDVTRNDAEPDSMGLYALCVFNEKDTKACNAAWNQTYSPGIHIPDDDTSSS